MPGADELPLSVSVPIVTHASLPLHASITTVAEALPLVHVTTPLKVRCVGRLYRGVLTAPTVVAAVNMAWDWVGIVDIESSLMEAQSAQIFSLSVTSRMQSIMKLLEHEPLHTNTIDHF